MVSSAINYMESRIEIKKPFLLKFDSDNDIVDNAMQNPLA